MIVALHSQLIGLGQRVRSNGIPVKHSPSPLSPPLPCASQSCPAIHFPQIYYQGVSSPPHNCCLSLPDSDCGIFTGASGIAANSAAGARRAPISVCCRCVGAEINHRLKLAKIMHSIHLSLINTLQPIMHG